MMIFQRNVLLCCAVGRAPTIDTIIEYSCGALCCVLIAVGCDTVIKESKAVGMKTDSSKRAGCLQLLDICWNLKTLLEISLNLYGSPGNFCVKC